MSSLAQSMAQAVFGHRGISRRLEMSPWAQHVARHLHLRQWVNGALTLRPIRRVHRASGVRYNIENFEALSVEKSYFDNPIYREIFSGKPPKTFLDLGCNSGIFPCLLAHLNGGQPLSGICIDANSAQVALAQKNLQLNRWKNIHVIHGLVGAKNPERERAEFFLHPTSLGSSQFNYSTSESGVPPNWREIEAPVISASALWNNYNAEISCDCLKVDIEGSEMNFFRQEVAFLDKVRSILVEWHSWTTSKAEVTLFLSQQRFSLVKTIEDTPSHGVLYFTKLTEDC